MYVCLIRDLVLMMEKFRTSFESSKNAAVFSHILEQIWDLRTAQLSDKMIIKLVFRSVYSFMGRLSFLHGELWDFTEFSKILRDNDFKSFVWFRGNFPFKMTTPSWQRKADKLSRFPVGYKTILAFR